MHGEFAQVAQQGALVGALIHHVRVAAAEFVDLIAEKGDDVGLVSGDVGDEVVVGKAGGIITSEGGQGDGAGFWQGMDGAFEGAAVEGHFVVVRAGEIEPAQGEFGGAGGGVEGHGGVGFAVEDQADVVFFGAGKRGGLDQQAQAAVVGRGLGDPQDRSEGALRVRGDFVPGDEHAVKGHAKIPSAVLGDGRRDGRALLRQIDGGRHFAGNGERDEAGQP